MLRWNIDRDSQRSHLVRGPSLSSPAVMDTGMEPSISPRTLPLANPAIQDLVDGPAAGAIPLLDYRSSRNHVYTHAGPALVACGNPETALDRDTLRAVAKRAIDIHGEYGFVLRGATAPRVLEQLVCHLSTDNKRCMAAVRLINLFAGHPHHVIMHMPRCDAQWSVAPGRLPHTDAFALFDQAAPLRVRERFGAPGAPTSSTAYAPVHADLMAVGLDEKDEFLLWHGIHTAQLLLAGDRTEACKCAGIVERTIPLNASHVELGHFIYRRTVEWLVVQINQWSPGPSTSHTGTIQLFCAPSTTPTTLDALYANWANERACAEFERWWTAHEELDYERNGVEWDRSAADDYPSAAALAYLQQTVATRLVSANSAASAAELLGATFRVQHTSGEVEYDTASLFAQDRDETVGTFQGVLEISCYLSAIALAGGRPSSLSASSSSDRVAISPHTQRRPRCSSAVSAAEMLRSSAPAPRRANAYHAGILRHRIAELDTLVSSIARAPHTYLFCAQTAREIEPLGLLGALVARDRAFGIRIETQAFCDAYRLLAPTGYPGQTISPQLVASVMALGDDQCTVGRHKVFLHHSALQLLDERVCRQRDAAALLLQKWWRGVCAREAYFLARGCIIMVQALVRRRQAITRYRSLRAEAIRAFNKQPGVARSEHDHLRAQLDERTRMCSTLAERGDALLSVVRRAFADEYGWEEAVWRHGRHSGEFQPYAALPSTIERALTRETIYPVRISSISYGAIVALKVLRYAGYSTHAYSALCAASARARDQGSALAACETLVYAMVLGSGDLDEQAVCSTFNRAMDFACGRFTTMLSAQFHAMVARPGERGAASAVGSLLRVVVATTSPDWLREVVVRQVCAALDRSALDHVMITGNCSIGARWAMEALMALEGQCSAQLDGLDTHSAFPMLFQTLKACQLGDKALLLQSDVLECVCPTLARECLERIFALYRVDAQAGEMLPHDLHRRLRPAGGCAGETPTVKSRLSPNDMRALAASQGLGVNRLLLEVNQRVPDTIARAMSKT